MKKIIKEETIRTGRFDLARDMFLYDKLRAYDNQPAVVYNLYGAEMSGAISVTEGKLNLREGTISVHTTAKSYFMVDAKSVQRYEWVYEDGQDAIHLFMKQGYSITVQFN